MFLKRFLNYLYSISGHIIRLLIGNVVAMRRCSLICRCLGGWIIIYMNVMTLLPLYLLYLTRRRLCTNLPRCRSHSDLLTLAHFSCFQLTDFQKCSPAVQDFPALDRNHFNDHVIIWSQCLNYELKYSLHLSVVLVLWLITIYVSLQYKPYYNINCFCLYAKKKKFYYSWIFKIVD